MNAVNPRGLVAVRADGGNDVNAVIAKALGDFAAEFKAYKERSEAKIAGLEADLTDAVQRGHMPLGLPGTSAGGGSAALAALLTKDSAWQDVASKRSKSTSIEVDAAKMLSIQANTLTTDSGGLRVAENVGIVGAMQRKRWLRERLVTAFTTGGSVEFSRETFSNSAAEQGGGSPFVFEGVPKAESSISYTLEDVKVSTIAHFFKASRQILNDVVGLRQVLENRLIYGLELRLENQILNGLGTGAQMAGLFKSGNHTAFTPTSGDTALDSISRALGTLAATYEATGDLVLLNPIDYRAMQRTKAVDSGMFLFGNPNGADSDQVWAVPIHATPAVTQGKFAVMDSRQMGTLRIRQDARVEAGYDGDDFTSNLVTLLGELRAVITVERPAATMYGSLTT